MASSATLRPGRCLGFMDTDHFRHRAVGLSLLGLGVILSQHIFLAWGVHETVAWRSIRTTFLGCLWRLYSAHRHIDSSHPKKETDRERYIRSPADGPKKKPRGSKTRSI